MFKIATFLNKCCCFIMFNISFLNCGVFFYVMKLEEMLEDKFTLMDGPISIDLVRCFGPDIIAPEVNLTSNVVAEFHRRYMLSGAKIISTNTTDGNAHTFEQFLTPRRNIKKQGRDVGLEESAHNFAYRHNLEGVRHAKVIASQAEVLVTGSIGPIACQKGPANYTDLSLTTGEIRDAYEPLIGALAIVGVDFFNIDYARDINEVEVALHLCKEANPDIPVAVQFVPKYLGYDGSHAKYDIPALRNQIKEVQKLDVDGVGVVCGPNVGNYQPIVRAALSGLDPTVVFIRPNTGTLSYRMGDRDFDADGVDSFKGLLGFLDEYPIEHKYVIGVCCHRGAEHTSFVRDMISDI